MFVLSKRLSSGTKTKNMKAIIQTKSNYRNLNGTKQEVVEVVKNRVTCRVWVEEFQKYMNVDFAKSEATLTA
jgi:hypothetical protein